MAGAGPARSYLHTRLREPQALAELLAHEGVRVVGLVEEPLQLVELLEREVGATTPLFQLRLAVFVLRLHVLALLLALVDTCGRAEGTGLRAQGSPRAPCASLPARARGAVRPRKGPAVRLKSQCVPAEQGAPAAKAP